MVPEVEVGNTSTKRTSELFAREHTCDVCYVYHYRKKVMKSYHINKWRPLEPFSND